MRRPIVRNIARMTYSHAVKGNWGTAVKILAGYNWRRPRPNSNYNSGSNFVRTDHHSRNMETEILVRVKIIRSDNGTEFKNRDMLVFCGNKGIKQEYKNARTS
ncbi:putative ribonuclease H-like domain-containing protein [Tanacetum coccineum]|uniref:Ribonuclease H-like domain-containing protein n=1 Tax=Tanacetum coccineum TaxID=301880 RepID=A0ABQ4YI62_9ASTR